MKKVNTRVSAAKHRKMTSFRRRMKTRGGRAIINRQRARATGHKRKAVKRAKGPGGSNAFIRK